ncbi:MAG: hypothetical protein ACFFB2_13885 [Promethearchaeota archaeon]
MSDFGLEDEIPLRISVLSHPDSQTTQLIHLLQRKYPKQSSFENISVISANLFTLRWNLLNNKIKMILIQPVSKYFTDKLHKRFYQTSSAVILFSDYDSEVAAKVFYQNYRRTVGLTNPVVFVELIDDSRRIIINEPETLDNLPNEAYYSIKTNDVHSFKGILESLASKCYKETLANDPTHSSRQIFRVTSK